MEINIILREMNKTRFDEYCDASIREYAEDLIKSGSASSENAIQLAQKDFDDILPNGYSTPNASIFSVFNAENEDVGLIWYVELPGEVAYIGDFLIDERHRRRGYGAMTLTALEEHAAAKGLQHVALNVFDHNPEAKALYEKMGYKEVREDQGCMQMAKSLKTQH